MQGAASVSNGLQHEPKTNGKIISSSTKNSDIKNSDQNSNQLNEEQWDWCKGLPPKSSEAFWQKKMLVLTHYQRKIWQKCSTITKKKPTLSPNYIHMYKIVEKCAHYQQAHVILEKNKKYSKLWCFEKIAWVFIVYM